MQEKTARSIVHALAGTVWLLTAFITVLTLRALDQWQFFSLQGMQLSSTFILAVSNLIIILVLGIAIGYGLWTKKRWARILAIIFSILIIIDLLIYQLTQGFDIASILSLLTATGIIWLLGFHQDIKQLFRKA